MRKRPQESAKGSSEALIKLTVVEPRLVDEVNGAATGSCGNATVLENAVAWQLR
jgi:hypothetical protein